MVGWNPRYYKGVFGCIALKHLAFYSDAHASNIVQYQLHLILRVFENVLSGILRRPANLPSTICLQRTPAQFGQHPRTHTQHHAVTHDPPISTGTNSLGHPRALAASSRDSLLASCRVSSCTTPRFARAFAICLYRSDQAMAPGRPSSSLAYCSRSALHSRSYAGVEYTARLCRGCGTRAKTVAKSD